MTRYHYYSDGSNSAPKGNAPAGAAVYITDDQPNSLPVFIKFMLEQGTNNDAEIHGYLQAVLHFAAIRQAGDVAVFHTDSQWVARIVAGFLNLDYMEQYQLALPMQPRFKPILQQIKAVWDHERMFVKWIPRTQNRQADLAAGQARNEAIKRYK